MTEITYHNHHAGDFAEGMEVYVELPPDSIIERERPYSNVLVWTIHRNHLANNQNTVIIERINSNSDSNVIKVGPVWNRVSFKPWHVFPSSWRAVVNNNLTQISGDMYANYCPDCEDYVYFQLFNEQTGYCQAHARARGLIAGCAACGGTFLQEDLTFTRDDFLLCNNCYTSHTHECDYCHNHFYSTSNVRSDGHEAVCRVCYIENFFECIICGTRANRENAYVPNSPMDDLMVCSEECLHDITDPPPEIHGYHGANPIEELGYGRLENSEERPYYLGIEMEYEIKRGWSSSQVRRALRDEGINRWAILMRDGSLRNGVEIITYPSNFNDLYSKFRELFRGGLANKVGLTPAGTTGMHVNISRNAWKSNYALATANMVVNNFPSLIQPIAGRSQNRYCKLKRKDIGEAEEDAMEGSPDRYVSLNIKHHVAELRIFKAAGRIDKFHDRMTFAQFLVDFGNFCHDKDLLPNRQNIADFISKNNKYVRLQKYLPNHFAELAA